MKHCKDVCDDCAFRERRRKQASAASNGTDGHGTLGAGRHGHHHYSASLDGRYASTGQILLSNGQLAPVSQSLVFSDGRFYSMTRNSNAIVEASGRVETDFLGRSRLIVEEGEISGGSRQRTRRRTDLQPVLRQAQRRADHARTGGRVSVRRGNTAGVLRRPPWRSAEQAHRLPARSSRRRMRSAPGSALDAVLRATLRETHLAVAVAEQLLAATPPNRSAAESPPAGWRRLPAPRGAGITSA